MLFAFILSLSSQVFASAFDADFEPCYRHQISYSEIKLEGEKLLEGDKNFILFKDQSNGQGYYALNCPRRVFALQVVNDRNQKYNDVIVKKALEVLAYQSTFTPEVATAVIEFIKSRTNQDLRAYASFTFYYLFDHFPNIGIQLDYFKKKSFKEFYRGVLITEANPLVTFWFAQVAQKTAGFFYDPGNSKGCYRTHFDARTRELGEEMARTLLPIVARALVAKGNLTSEDDLVSKNELLVAIGNFAYSRFLKYDASTLQLFKDYFHLEKSNDFTEMLLRVPAISEFIKGERTLSNTIPAQDSYCGPSGLSSSSIQ